VEVRKDVRDERPVPVDVTTAAQLWWGVIGFGVVSMAAGVVEGYGHRAELAGENGSTRLVVTMLGVSVVLGVLLSAAFLLVLRKLQRARNWARMIVTLVGGILVLGALFNVVGLVSPDGPVSLVIGAAGIIQGVLAAGAIFLLHRGESNSYFLRFPPSQ